MISQRLWIRAIKEAEQSKGVGGNSSSYRLGAVLFKNRKLLKTGRNSFKTHPLLKEYSPYAHRHAETDAIIRYGLDNCIGLSILVVRIKKDGSLGLAKPCNVCLALSREAGIHKIYYSIGGSLYGVVKP